MFNLFCMIYCDSDVWLTESMALCCVFGGYSTAAVSEALKKEGYVFLLS